MKNEKPEFLKALLEVQKTLKPIGKNQDGYNYKYADLPKVWEEIHSILQINGFFVTHKITPEGVLTTVMHEHGELQSFIPFVSGNAKPQEIGSEITYYKRYNIGAIFNLVIVGEDDDGQAAQAVPTKEVKAGKCTICGQQLKVSKAGNAYCPGKYNNSCKPKRELSPSDQAFSDSLDDIPTIHQGNNQGESGGLESTSV